MRLLICLLVTSSCLILVNNIFASPLTDARQAFSQGDLPKTIQTLESKLFPTSKLSKAETTPALELFGISQFMMGEKKSAEKAFKIILSASPNHRLDKKFALDPAVEPFFESLKKSAASSKKSSAATKSSKASKSLPKKTESFGKRNSVAHSAPPPRPKPRATPRPAPKAAVTALIVQTNAPKTTLFIDGIFIGAGNQTITVDPGQHQLTISAEGYESVDRKITVEKGKTLKLSVRLTKPGEAQRIAAAKNSRSRAASKNSAKRRTQQQSSFEDSGPRKAMRFDTDLPGENKRKTQQSSRPKQNSRSRRSLADEFFQEPAPPAYAPQYQQPPVYQAPAPMYQQPQYPYPYPQPAYPAPGYAPQYAPPAYAYPQPDPYAAPSYPNPPMDAYGAPNPYEEEYEAGDGSVPMGGGYPAPANGGYRARKRNNGRSAFLAVLPFGVGQYQNGHKVKGTIFLLSELGLPAFGYFYYDSAIKAAQKLFEQQIAEENDPTYEPLPKDELEANQKFREDTLKNYANYQKYCYYATGALYLIGVIDAFVYINDSPPRRRAEIDFTRPDRAFSYNLLPTSNGGVHLKLSLNLE